MSDEIPEFETLIIQLENAVDSIDNEVRQAYCFDGVELPAINLLVKNIKCLIPKIERSYCIKQKAQTNNGGDLEFYEGTSPHQVSMFIEHTKKFHDLHPKDDRSAWALLRYLVLIADYQTRLHIVKKDDEIEQKDKRIAELEARIKKLETALNHKSGDKGRTF